MAKPILRDMIAAKRFVVAPGIQDMITARVADDVGFDIVYGSGFWLAASALGLPDAGIATYTEMLDRMTTLVRSTRSAVVADADTGYGGLLNVQHTVRGFEDAGVTAIQIEDQQFPKKCGHTPNKRVVPTEEMVRKIEVACEARRDANLVIIARTDARANEGLDAAIERARRYGAAGADILFVEALRSEAEMRQACAAIDQPMMANISNGGLTPALSAATLEEIGYAMAIYPAMTSLIAAQAMHVALSALKATGNSEGTGQDLFDFNRFCRLNGFEEVWAFEKKWAEDEPV